MDNFVLLIDDLGRIEAVLERVLADTELRIESFHDPVTAKRRLIESSPVLIISLHSFQNHPEGGFRLARELSNHDQLAKIPLVIISDQLSEEVIRLAADSGAKSLIPWPVTIDSLRNRLKPFLRTFIEDEPEFPEQHVTDTIAPAPAAEIAAPTTSDQKIQLAQQLLAKVLHNLKTSALLDVIDLEDVPQVVMEIMRGICGIKVSEKKPGERPAVTPIAAATPQVPPQPAPTPSQQLPKSEITADLDRVFGLKK